MSNKYAGRPLHVTFFVSRNKDNQEVPDFKQRNQAFLTQKTPEELKPLFEEFVRKGVPGEFNRMYYTVNARKPEALLKLLQHYLIDNPDVNLVNSDKLIASLAMQKGTKATKRFLFDYDADPERILEFLDDIAAYDVAAGAFATPNGYGVITEHGFDTRRLLAKWEDVGLHRDGHLCHYWATTEEEQL